MTTPAANAESPSETFDALTSWIENTMFDLEVPGVAVGVVIGDQRYTHATGVTKVGTADRFTTSTRIGIASLTKIFTATALATLANDGAVNLNDPVRQHLPDFTLSESDATAAVTVGHLLSHAGGWADVLDPVPGQDSLAWYASQMASLPQVVPVGTQFSYSNLGFMLAGAIIEQLTGTSYEDAISQSILQPLGMRLSGFTAATGAFSS